MDETRDKAAGGLSLRVAGADEYERVRAFYHSMTRAMRDAPYGPGWRIDVYPAPEFLMRSLRAGELHVGEADGKMACAMVLNREWNEGYGKLEWPSCADMSECLMVHALGVHPDHARRGYAKEMVRRAVSVAQKAGMRAVRLDVLAGNVPAERLYEGLGFRKTPAVQMFYEDTGWAPYEGYELALDPDGP